jgi:hypothetical protein
MNVLLEALVPASYFLSEDFRMVPPDTETNYSLASAILTRVC